MAENIRQRKAREAKEKRAENAKRQSLKGTPGEMAPVKTVSKEEQKVLDTPTSAGAGILNKFKKQVKSMDLSPFAKGEARADKILGPEGLRTQEMRDVMDMRKKQATEGISPEQQLAMKTKMAKQMMQAEQAAGLKLGSALGGVKGAAAGSQVRSLQAQGLQARAGIERDMFMAQEAAKQQGITALEDTARFDVGQIGKEKELRATLGMGFEALQAQRDAAALSAQATRDAAPKSRGGLLGGSIIPGLL